MVGEITRRIRFYQVSWVRRNGDIVPKDNTFFDSISAPLCRVNEMDPTYDISMELYDKAALGVSDLNKSFYKLSKIRRTDLPLKHDYTRGADLPLGLESTEGLSEPTHFVVFNGAIIGTEYNHYGPRIAVIVEDIKNHLNANPVEDIIGVQITPILKPGILERIDRITEVSSIYIKIATDYARLISQEEDESVRTLLAAADLTQDAFLKIEYTVGPGRKLKPRSAFKNVIGPLRAIISRKNDMGSIEAAQIRGKEFGSSVPKDYDLLEEQLITKHKVAKIDAETRAVNSIDMYKAILGAYTSLRSELEKYIPI